MSLSSASCCDGATVAPRRSATNAARAGSMSQSWTSLPSARNMRAVSAPLTPHPITAVVSAPDRQSVSAAITAAAAVRSAVTAAASMQREERAGLRVGEQHEPGDGGEALGRVSRERRHPFQHGVAVAERRHGPEVAVLRARDVDLRLHRPRALGVGDERRLDRVVGLVRRDGPLDVGAGEERHGHALSLEQARSRPREPRRATSNRSARTSVVRLGRMRLDASLDRRAIARIVRE